jgi:hypothetical protein
MKSTRAIGFGMVTLLSLAGACSSGSKSTPMGSGGHVGTAGAGGSGTGGSSSTGAGGTVLVGSCTGTPEYCVMYETKAGCQTVGCYWSDSNGIRICEGVGSPCATFTTESSCKFAGCTWILSVAPVGGTGGATGSGGAITNGGATGSGGKVGLGDGSADNRAPEIPERRDGATVDAPSIPVGPDLRPSDAPGPLADIPASFDLPLGDTPRPEADLTIDLALRPLLDAELRDLPPSVDALPALSKLEIGPACAHLEVGRTFAFKAWGTTASASRIDVTAQVAWASSMPGVASFAANAPGVATAVAPGDFEVTVSGGGLTASLPGRVAAWATTKLDQDVDPKDLHVMTTSLGAVPDRSGLAAAAWLVPDSTSRMGVAYREYDPATATWSAVAMLDTGTDGEVVDVRMRVSPVGNLLALWMLHFEGSNTYEVWATDRVSGTWHAPVRISTQGSTVDEMSLSMNHSSMAMAIWDEGVDPDEDTRVAIYNATQGWLSPVSIAGTSVEAQIDYDDSNQALALWAGLGLQSRHYRAPRGGWETTTSTVSKNAAYYPGLASEGQGAYLAAWAEAAPVTGTKDRIVWVSRYTPDTGWAGLTYYGWDGTEANFPSIAGNWSSGSVVTWEQYMGSGADWDMYAAFCPVGRNCDSPVSLGFIQGSSPQGRAAVTVHKSGSAVVVWSGLDGLNLSRYYPGTGWAKSERVFADHDSAHPWNPRTFIDDNCRLFVSWKEDGSILYNPYAAVFR